jgi:hypothetical protein
MRHLAAALLGDTIRDEPILRHTTQNVLFLVTTRTRKAREGR